MFRWARLPEVPYALIADLDYIEEIGTDDIRLLFVVDKIRVDVIDNVKSRDGASLGAAIDKAIATGSWEGAEDGGFFASGFTCCLPDHFFNAAENVSFSRYLSLPISQP